MKAYYENAKLYILTSIMEGFSNSMLEALGFGVPILSMSVDPDNVLIRYKLGYVSENDWNKFCHYFERILKDSDMKKYVSDNARKYLRENHDAGLITEKFKEILLTLNSMEKQ
jgi:glycosyltransferase involved in cell wall biosynthesis